MTLNYTINAEPLKNFSSAPHCPRREAAHRVAFCVSSGIKKKEKKIAQWMKQKKKQNKTKGARTGVDHLAAKRDVLKNEEWLESYLS